MLANPSAKPGRNDPCPCGSGKKYKHCCLRKDAADQTLWAEVRAASDHLAEEILRFAVREFDADIEDAWDEFHFGLPNEPFEHGAAENAIFLPYFLFHWNPHRPPSSRMGASGEGIVAKAFLQEKSARLTEMERQLLQESVKQPFSFYEALSSRPGEAIALRDILTGQETQVREREASKAVRAGDIIFGQVTSLPGIAILGCSAPLVIPPGMKADVIELRKKLRRRAEREGRAVSVEDLVRREEDIREVYLDIRDMLHAPPRICNTDGDPVVLHAMTFEIDSPQAAFEALAPLAQHRTKEELLRNAQYDAEGRLRKVEFSWIKEGNRKFKTWENTVLGTIRLLDHSLIAEANSEKRAARLRSEIEKRLGPAAVHKNTVAKSCEELLEKRDQEPSSGAEQDRAKLDALLEDPEIQKRGRELMQKELEAWVHKKVPVLGGRTPMQAVKHPEGKEILEALLNDFERRAQEKSPAWISPDITVLRRLLNLPEKKL